MLAPCRDPGRVAVAGVNTDAREVLRGLETKVGPRLPGVVRAVHTIALLNVAADLRLTRADVYHVRVGFADLYRTHRRTGDLVVGDVGPRRAGIGGLPQTSTAGAEVVFERPGLAAGDSGAATATRRADVLPAQILIQLSRIGLSVGAQTEAADGCGGNQP